MLSRHFLRAKALQTIYAGVCNQISSADELVKAFDHNVMRLNDLGLYQLSTLSQFTFTAERIMEVEMQKFNPQQKELDYLKRIADNKFISRLESGFEFKQQMNRLSIDWSNHFDIFRKILTQLKTSQQYQDYAAISDPTFDDDRNLAIQVFKIMMNDNALRSIIFERDLLWEDDFDQVAQYVYMLLKECTEENTNEASPCPQIYDSRNEKDANDFKFARKLTIDTYNHIDDVESMIKKHLQNWDFDRVALMDVLLINMAVTEFTCCPSIPERVTVDEYIELSKEFSTERSKLFINGILDKFIIELRSAGRINKSGRGLIDPTMLEEDSE